MHYNLFFNSRTFAEITDTKEMYLVPVDTIKKTIVKFLYTFKFRNVAEFFYLVMFPAVEAKGFFIQNINNICKSTVN